MQNNNSKLNTSNTLSTGTSNPMLKAFMQATTKSESAAKLVNEAKRYRAIEDKKIADKIACAHNARARQWDKEHAKQVQFENARAIALAQLQEQERVNALARQEQEARAYKAMENRARLIAQGKIQSKATTQATTSTSTAQVQSSSPGQSGATTAQATPAQGKLLKVIVTVTNGKAHVHKCVDNQ